MAMGSSTLMDGDLLDRGLQERLLYRAIEANAADDVELLVEGDSDLANCRDFEGNAPLYVACRDGATQRIVLALLKAGAKPNESCSFGTALHAAANRGDADTCGVLLTHGAELEVENPYGRTPEQMVAHAWRLIISRRGRYQAVIEVFERARRSLDVLE